MYRNILICLDNSDYSLAAADRALEMALSTGAALTGIHVYAAGLHRIRFREMEGGLPERYRNGPALERQREIHNDLITKGLRVISDSYISVLEAKAAGFGLSVRAVQREGKNYSEITDEACAGDYDLVVMGAFGLGKTTLKKIGTVCSRVARRIDKDILVIKNIDGTKAGPVVVAVDGSTRSFGALRAGAFFSRLKNLPLEVAAVYDPLFHQTAFRSIAGVLSEGAARLFRFREQEMLHSEIIDRGLARIYDGHIKRAVKEAAVLGVEAKPVLLSGRPFEALASYVKERDASLLALGRTGIHADDGLDLGGLAEGALWGVETDLLIAAACYSPEPERAEGGPSWTFEAKAVLERIPEMARGVARSVVEEAAQKDGVDEITPHFMEKVRRELGL